MPDDCDGFPTAVAQAIGVLREAGVGGPYAIALGPGPYTGLTETAYGGYPVLNHVRLLLEGPVVWAPAVECAVVLSVRGGDFELISGQDLSIGYVTHDAASRAAVPPGEHDVPGPHAGGGRRHRGSGPAAPGGGHAPGSDDVTGGAVRTIRYREIAEALRPRVETRRVPAGSPPAERVGPVEYHNVTTYTSNHNIELVAKLNPSITQGGRKSEEEFQFNKDAGMYVCKAGHMAVRKARQGRKGVGKNQVDTYYFDIDKCKRCPFKEGCYTEGTKSKSYSVSINLRNTPNSRLPACPCRCSLRRSSPPGRRRCRRAVQTGRSR